MKVHLCAKCFRKVRQASEGKATGHAPDYADCDKCGRQAWFEVEMVTKKE